MMAASKHRPQPQRHVLVVRLWRSPAGGSWRGQIVHVESGQTVNFGSDEQLLAYIRHHLNTQADESGHSGLR